MLTMLKTDLGILTTTAYDTRLGQLLTAAKTAIIKEGATTLDDGDPLDINDKNGVWLDKSFADAKMI